MKRTLFFIVFFIHLTYFLSIVIAQPKCYIEHYGAKDGLPQHTVMDILQDQKGFMWFSTWDGLCKFDGYEFKTYKIEQNHVSHMRSNRIDHIMEDMNGYIWTLSYGNEIHRFDPRTEKFVGLKSPSDKQDFTFFASKMMLSPSGKVWLISKDMGCISVVDSTFRTEVYNTKNKKIGNNFINSIFEDKDKNSWILTDEGLFAFSFTGEALKTSDKTNNTKENTPFYSATEIHNEIWFGCNQGKVWIYNKKNKLFRSFETESSANIIEIKNIDSNRILITTDSNLFFIFDIKSDLLKKHSISKGLHSFDQNIRSSYIDNYHNIWLEQKRLGITRFDTGTESFTYFGINAESPIVNVTAPNFLIIEDKENRIWVHPKGGGFSFYDAKANKLLPFFNQPNSPNWKFSGMLHAAYLDKQNNLWLSTHSNGLEKVVFSDDIFKTLLIDTNLHSTMSNFTRCVFEDNERNLWVSTKDGKIQIYDPSHNNLGYLCDDGTIGRGKPIAGITYCMMQDTAKNIWIGTKGNGIYKLVLQKNSNRFQIAHFTHQISDLYSLSSNNVYSIYQDKQGKIWVGTYGGGLNLMDSQSENRFFNHRNVMKNYPLTFGSQVRVVAEDKNGNMCIGTTLGLIMFSLPSSNLENIDYKFYTRQSDVNSGLTANDVYDIITTRKGDTFLATFGGGINKIMDTDSKGFPSRFSSFTTKDGLSSDITLLITEDHDGKLWISTESNVSKFDPDKNLFKTYSEIYRLTKGEAFSEGAKCISRTGIVYFGYAKGVLAINPNIIKDNTFKPYVALTNFQIANQDIKVGENSPLSASIDDLTSLDLNHNQNFFNIEFAAIDYVENKQIMYAYILDGFDKEWIITHNQRVATYNNLLPKEYIFRVRSTNSDGIWMENEHTLKINIIPSFWQTGWANLLYVILITAILAVILRSLFIYYRLKDKMILEQEQIEMKTRFFMDISHEIRTPLTMVVSPIENILEHDYSQEETRNQLQLVLKNANRMLRMVNQILDFRKIQKKKLNVQETQIGDYVADICQSFTKSAEIQKLSLIINNTAGDEKLWIDRDSVEKLVFNLLSNAFKYTPLGKSINVNIYKKNNSIAIEVEDEGKGMTKEIQNKLFTRFTSFSADKSKPSTGIGLSLVKEVADKHNAKIQVESKPDTGSKFTVVFPLGFNHFKENEVNIVYEENGKEDKSIQKAEGLIEYKDVTISTYEANPEKQSILVVEDDIDLRGFIKNMLSNYYTVYEAENGKYGYEFAIANLPDFILSDIMMPEMDGVELLQKIRNNQDTSHIPVILLTAKTDIESRLEGLRYGADDYITKPFSVKYLKARIENIILQRKLLYRSYTNSKPIINNTSLSKEETFDKEHEYIITPEDKLFIEKVKKIIEDNIDNGEFVVDDLVSKMAMSRTVFFKKLKSLTSLAPIEFIREIKIKYAAHLIISHDYTIKEISFMIGIADTKYFAKWFKSIMGMTPSEYRDNNKHQKGI